MLAGIYDPRRQSSELEVSRRLRSAFGSDAESGARYIGSLAVVSDRFGGDEAAGCALEGSVYNHPELAAELGEDPRLSTESLLARAYERWDKQMLVRLRGAFALVAWTAGGARIL